MPGFVLKCWSIEVLSDNWSIEVLSERPLLSYETLESQTRVKITSEATQGSILWPDFSKISYKSLLLQPWKLHRDYVKGRRSGRPRFRWSNGQGQETRQLLEELCVKRWCLEFLIKDGLDRGYSGINEMSSKWVLSSTNKLLAKW